MIRKKLPDKYLDAPLTDQQDLAIDVLARQKSIPFILAKHQYFEQHLTNFF